MNLFHSIPLRSFLILSIRQKPDLPNCLLPSGFTPKSCTSYFSLSLSLSLSFLWLFDPTRVIASSFLRFLDHTQRRTTVGRTSLDEWSARRRDLYLTTHDTHNKQTSMPPVGFEPTISAGERPQTHALDRAATGTDQHSSLLHIPYSPSTFFLALATKGGLQSSSIPCGICGNQSRTGEEFSPYILYFLY